jgi:hypothetical protein
MRRSRRCFWNRTISRLLPAILPRRRTAKRARLFCVGAPQRDVSSQSASASRRPASRSAMIPGARRAFSDPKRRFVFPSRAARIFARSRSDPAPSASTSSRWKLGRSPSGARCIPAKRRFCSRFRRRFGAGAFCGFGPPRKPISRRSARALRENPRALRSISIFALSTRGPKSLSLRGNGVSSGSRAESFSWPASRSARDQEERRGPSRRASAKSARSVPRLETIERPSGGSDGSGRLTCGRPK